MHGRRHAAQWRRDRHTDTVLLRFLASFTLLIACACAQAMEFQRVGSTLVMSGPVVGDDLARLKDHLADGDIRLVVLHDSPGGDLWNGQQLAHLIRASGLDTTVAGSCESSCGLIFLGGVRRSYSDGDALGRTKVGLHGAVHALSRQAMPELGARMAHLISSMTGGRYPAALLQRTVYPSHPDNFVYAYHPDMFPQDGVRRGVFECVKQSPRGFKCDMQDGLDAVAIGLVTETEVLALPPEVKVLLHVR